jgi:hypothetical protein
LGTRRVYVEHWATVALAQAIAADPEVAPWLGLQLNPACRVEAETLHFPIAKSAAISESEVARIALATGATSLAEAQRRFPDLVERMLRKRILAAGLPVPTVLDCLAWLREQLARLPESCPARDRWISRLDELAALCEQYRGARLAGRRAARAAIETRFTEWTAASPTRRQGRMFVGRKVVHELCGRSAALELGPLATELQRDLAPLCELARWSWIALATGWEHRMVERLAPLARDGRVDLMQALHAFRPEEQAVDIDRQIERQLVEAWSAAVGPRYGEELRELTLEPETLSEVRRALPAIDEREVRADELVGADFHSPDLLIAARSDEAVRRGEYQIVVGELHAGVFSVSSPIYLPFCSWPEAVIRFASRLVPDPFLALVDSPATYNYGDLLWPDMPALREVEHERTRARVDAGRALPIAQLSVRLEGGRAYVCDRAGTVRQRLIAFYCSFLQRKIFGLSFVPFSGARGARVSVGRLVLRRRAWRFSATESPTVDAAGVRTLEGWLSVRRWQAHHELPDRIFSKVRGEPKPVMVDFRSPLLVAAWLRMLGGGHDFWCQEMLPAPEQCWLVDERGRCATEIRLTLRRATS